MIDSTLINLVFFCLHYRSAAWEVLTPTRHPSSQDPCPPAPDWRVADRGSRLQQPGVRPLRRHGRSVAHLPERQRAEGSRRAGDGRGRRRPAGHQPDHGGRPVSAGALDVWTCTTVRKQAVQQQFCIMLFTMTSYNIMPVESFVE